MRHLLPILLLTIAACSLAGCNSADCDENRNSLPLAGFYAGTPAEQVSLSGLTVYGDGVPGDSLLLNNASGVDEVYLPFRINEDNTTFVFDFGDVTDEVTFKYETTPRFASAECGVVYDYRITDIGYTTARIDSVRCPDGIITNRPGINIRIFLHSPE